MPHASLSLRIHTPLQPSPPCRPGPLPSLAARPAPDCLQGPAPAHPATLKAPSARSLQPLPLLVRPKVRSLPTLPSRPARPARPALALLLVLLAGLALLLPWPEPVLAGVAQREQAYHGLFDAPCRRFGLPKDVALAIARQESDGHPLMINVEGRDMRPQSLAEACALVDRLWEQGRSFDVGLMQINVLWMRRYRIPPRLLLNPRNNVFMGCFLLAMQARQAGSLWKGVGHYHSRTPWRRDRYIAQVRRHLERLRREAEAGWQS